MQIRIGSACCKGSVKGAGQNTCNGERHGNRYGQKQTYREKDHYKRSRHLDLPPLMYLFFFTSADHLNPVDELLQQADLRECKRDHCDRLYDPHGYADSRAGRTAHVGLLHEMIGKRQQVGKEDQFDQIADQAEDVYALSSEIILESFHKLFDFDGFTVLDTVTDAEKSGPDKTEPGDLLRPGK